jgi:hypothetical protein
MLRPDPVEGRDAERRAPGFQKRAFGHLGPRCTSLPATVMRANTAVI